METEPDPEALVAEVLQIELDVHVEEGGGGRGSSSGGGRGSNSEATRPPQRKQARRSASIPIPSSHQPNP